jgi:hypothetical protein
MAQTVSPKPPSGRDWTVQTVDRIESIVETVRDKTTVPVTKAARAVVYGVIAVVMGALAALLLLIGLFRLHVYLPFSDEGRKVYATYLGLGAIFVGVGVLLWRRRLPTTGD